MNVESPAPCINVYKNEVPFRDFMTLVEAEMDNPWSDINWVNSSVGDGIVGQYRTSAESDVSSLVYSDSEIGKTFQQISHKILETIMPDYRTEHSVHTERYEGWRLLKYSGGGEYHAHYDHSPRNSRIVSIVCFLQEPNSGGQLEFPYFDVVIPARAGDCVVFPSNFPYTHIAHPVTAGTKCSLVTWLQ